MIFDGKESFVGHLTILFLAIDEIKKVFLFDVSFLFGVCAG